MEKTYTKIILQVSLALLTSMSGICAYPLELNSEGNWLYSTKSSGISGISNKNYYPQNLSEFSNATVQGYVTYSPEAGYAGWLRDAGNTTLGFHIFTTYVTSSQSLLEFKNGGDDGHSVFVDDQFIVGGGFGQDVYGSISFALNSTRKITVVVNNAIGEWQGNFFVKSATNEWITVESKPGVSINAAPPAVPEPSALCLGVLSSLLLALTHLLQFGGSRKVKILCGCGFAGGMRGSESKM